jgi:hypothetical protein
MPRVKSGWFPRAACPLHSLAHRKKIFPGSVTLGGTDGNSQRVY